MTGFPAIPTLPLKEWVSALVAFLNVHLAGFFAFLAFIIQSADGELRVLLRLGPPPLMIILIVAFIGLRRRAGAAILVLVALTLVWNMDAWPQAMDTVSLLILATVPAVILGLPVGMAIAENDWGRRILTPLLDYMQTTPAFVYLIPSVLFFGVGTVPGVFATAAFALPPFARAVALGLDQVPREVLEAGNSVGLTPLELMCKIKLPLAAPYLVTGLNQCVMMSLSMVVIASLIGARGLGTPVIESLTQMNFSVGIEAGICVVAVAITIDRMLESITLGQWIWTR
jgi:ABC-type proline/glycine betaine transport system permease subunit